MPYDIKAAIERCKKSIDNYHKKGNEYWAKAKNGENGANYQYAKHQYEREQCQRERLKYLENKLKSK